MRLKRSLLEGKIIKFPDLKAKRKESEPKHSAPQLSGDAADRVRAHGAMINSALDLIEDIRMKGASNASSLRSPAIRADRRTNAVQALFFSLPDPRTKADTWSRNEAFAVRFSVEHADEIRKAVKQDVSRLERVAKSISTDQARHYVERIVGDEILAYRLILQRIAELERS